MKNHIRKENYIRELKKHFLRKKLNLKSNKYKYAVSFL